MNIATVTHHAANNLMLAIYGRGHLHTRRWRLLLIASSFSINFFGDSIIGKHGWSRLYLHGTVHVRVRPLAAIFFPARVKKWAFRNRVLRCWGQLMLVLLVFSQAHDSILHAVRFGGWYTRCRCHIHIATGIRFVSCWGFNVLLLGRCCLVTFSLLLVRGCRSRQHLTANLLVHGRSRDQCLRSFASIFSTHLNS